MHGLAMHDTRKQDTTNAAAATAAALWQLSIRRLCGAVQDAAVLASANPTT
jgi:hypothetical protein